MAVTEYKPNSSLCKYTYSKLKDVIYLVSRSHVKDIAIDSGEAYIEDLTELPLRLNGFNIALQEESTLDERYKFTKSVTLSMHGYVNSSIFDDRYYVILESQDGTFWMVNVDFPAKLTYTFNLANNTYQTDFTLSSVSNFPTLKLNANFEAVSPPCLGLNVYGIDSLRLNENDNASLDTVNKVVYTYGKEFVDVEYLGNSCSLQEEFNGERVTTTISFNIAFDAYKSSWHYNLLEFLENKYVAIVKPKGNDNLFFSGFNFGLTPAFTVQTASQQGQSDVITVTLTEVSDRGTTASNEWSEEQSSDTRWVYVKKVGNITCYECIALGTAKYLVQQEVAKNGRPTGDYKCLEGYREYFEGKGLNIVDTFTNEETFSSPDCSGAVCHVSTDIPLTINYYSANCYTYSYSASCDWSVSGLASYMTVTPSSGVGGSAYTLSVCNTKTPTANESSTFTITSGDNVKLVNVNLLKDASFIRPLQTNITCLAQNVVFTFDANCPVTVTSIDQRLTYQLSNSQLTVNIPRNYSIESGVTWTIGVKDCNNNTATLTINQDKTFERWENTSDILCDGTTSYVKQIRYTGTTSTSILTLTSESRMGAKVSDNDSRCSSYDTRWVESDKFYCIDGNKWSFEEEEIKYEGGSWQKTGVTQLKTMVEANSSFCNESVQYEWRLTSKWQCEEQFLGKFKATYSGGQTNFVACDSSTELTSGETKPNGYVASAMTSAEIGSCVSSIGYATFGYPYSTSSDLNCTSLTSITIPNSVTTIDGYAFAGCSSLSSVTIPNSVTSIGSDRLANGYSGWYGSAFRDCTSLASVNIPNSVTYIGTNTFNGCHALSSVTIPNSITTINDGTFYHCTSLSSVTIPDSVTSIGYEAFRGCSLTSITIPSSVTKLDNGVFYYCRSLTNVTIPSGVTSIGGYAFGVTPWYRSFSASTSNRYNSFVYINDIAYQTVSTGITSYSNFREGTKTIGGNAFTFCSSLTSVTIPSSVTRIDGDAFWECSSLPSITIPSGVTSIGESAFAYCRKLASITFGENSQLTSIGNHAFVFCSGLTSVTIPDSVTSIGDAAFNNCKSLSNVTISNNLARIPNDAFEYCSSLTSVTIGSGVTSIGAWAFQSCSGLTSITVLATTPPALDNEAFYETNSNFIVYVPAASINAYKSASGWSSFASRIQAIP